MSSLTSAVAAVIRDPGGRVLLCQQSQGHRLWGLPGGKIRHGNLPDVLVHVFRGRVTDGDLAVNSPGRIRRLAWHDPDWLPHPVTATARVAVADAVAGLSGVIRDVHRDAEPEVPDAVDSALA